MRCKAKTFQNTLTKFRLGYSLLLLWVLHNITITRSFVSQTSAFFIPKKN